MSARIAVQRAEAHARGAFTGSTPALPPPSPEPVAAVPQGDGISKEAAWRRRCRQIREEIEAERASAQSACSTPNTTPEGKP